MTSRVLRYLAGSTQVLQIAVAEVASRGAARFCFNPPTHLRESQEVAILRLRREKWDSSRGCNSVCASCTHSYALVLEMHWRLGANHSSRCRGVSGAAWRNILPPSREVVDLADLPIRPSISFLGLFFYSTASLILKKEYLKKKVKFWRLKKMT